MVLKYITKGGAELSAYTYSKLKGRIAERYGTRKNFAKALNLSETAISLKLNNKTFFSQEDIEKWSGLLGISVEEYGEYFFA